MWLNSEQLPLIKRFFPIILLLISIIGSGWFYWESDSKVEQLLTSKEWQSMSKRFVLILIMVIWGR